MKKLVEVSSLNEMDQLSNVVEGFIIGYEKFTSFGVKFFSYAELTLISQKYPNRCYLNLNFLMHNNDKDEFINELNKLKDLNLHFIIQDLGASFVLKEVLGTLSNVIFNPYTYINNSGDAKCYLDLGFEAVMLSSEITLNDMNKIASNVTNLGCVGFGYHPMYQSYRHIIDLYKEQNKLIFNNDNLTIEEWNRRGDYAHVIDNEYGSVIFRPYVLSLLDSLQNVEYTLINTIFLTDEQKDYLFKYLSNQVDYSDLVTHFNIQDGFKYVDSVYNPKEFIL